MSRDRYDQGRVLPSELARLANELGGVLDLARREDSRRAARARRGRPGNRRASFRSGLIGLTGANCRPDRVRRLVVVVCAS